MKKESDVRDDRRRLTVVRSLAYVQSYVHSPYMYTVLRCPANRWGTGHLLSTDNSKIEARFI